MRMKLAVFLVVILACHAAPALAAEPIKIGAFFALSGPAANIGTPTKLVAQMVADKINKEGGINGRPIELIVGDTESDPTKAAVIAKNQSRSRRWWSCAARTARAIERLLPSRITVLRQPSPTLRCWLASATSRGEVAR